MTHFATADETGDDGFFARAARRVRALGARAGRAAARACCCTPPTAPPCCASPARTSTWSAAASPSTGWTRSARDPAAHGLEPALELELLRRRGQALRAPGRAPATGGASSPSATPSSALLPIGYGDGWRRGLSNNAEVLIGGRRHPLVGTVSMDNVTVDLGAEPTAALRGERAVLIGARASERITAEDLARAARHDQLRDHLRAQPRVARGYHRDGAPAVEAARATREPRDRAVSG